MEQESDFIMKKKPAKTLKEFLKQEFGASIRYRRFGTRKGWITKPEIRIPEYWKKIKEKKEIKLE